MMVRVMIEFQVMATLLDFDAFAPSAWLNASMVAGVMMATWKSYCLTHMLLVTLLACCRI